MVKYALFFLLSRLAQPKEKAPQLLPEFGALEVSTMQIDWLSAKVSTPPELWPGYESGRTLKLSADGEVLENRLTASQIEDDEPSSSKNFRVWTPTPGQLYLSGNPVKLLQGHNLFGSMDLLGLYLEAGVWVRQNSGLFPGPGTWDACEFSAPRYSRIDITRSYRFATDAEALDYVRFVAGNAKSRHGAAKLYDSGTAYFGQSSRRWTMKIYAKKQELLHGLRGAGRRISAMVFPDELLDWSTGIVRFELTLRGPELAKHSPPGDIHDSAFLARLWQSYFDSIQFNENAAMSTRPDLIEETLPRYLQLTVSIWRNGRDLRSALPQNTFYRHRREILTRCGIDIAVPHQRAASGSPVLPVGLSPDGWDPDPIASHLVEPRGDLKSQYPLRFESHQ
jgi:Phage replication protein CRI/Phage X family